MLVLENVRTHYGSIEALKGVSIHVQKGEIVTLIGANGAGKSTLLMTLCGNPQASSGNITFLDQDITKLPTSDIVRLGISQVPEGRRIFSKMTVFENLYLGTTIPGTDHFEEDLKKVFKMFPILEKRRHQRGGTLSGGEQQMLAIGRALISRPKVLLLDEPSLGLAPIIVKQIFHIIKQLNEEGMTILLVEQNAFHALSLATRAYVLCNGTIWLSGSGKELLANPEVRAAYLEGGSH